MILQPKSYLNFTLTTNGWK